MTPVSVAGGKQWSLVVDGRPVIVWAPDGYSGSDAVLYVHGYYVTAPGAMVQYRLADQFQKSGVKAYFIVPSAPSGKDEPVYFPDLARLLNSAGQQMGVFFRPPYVAIGHSGAYRTLVRWLANTGLKSVTLVDGLYANVSDFGNWAAKSGNKLTLVAATKPVITNVKKLDGKPNVTTLYPKATHMGLVTSGQFLPELIAKAFSQKLLWTVLGIGLAVSWFLFR